MFKAPLFSKDIEPACAWCEHALPSQDGLALLCEKCGIVSPSFCCKKYVYDPLKREPKPPVPLGTFAPEEFAL